MATTTRSTHAAARTGTQGLAWAVLVASVLEVVAPVVTISGPGASPAQGSGPELLITPVGWAFSIWGVIYTLAIVQAVATLVRGPGAVPRRLQVDLVVLYLGGALWILLAALDSSIATALALLLMLVAAVDAVLTVGLTTRGSSSEPGWFALLTRAAVGLFAGWVTAAFFLNLSTALVDLEVVSAQSVGWQLGVLAVAAVTLLAVLVRTGGNVAYAAAGAWAMLGIAVTGRADGTTSVLAASAVAGVAIVLTAAALLARRRA